MRLTLNSLRLAGLGVGVTVAASVLSPSAQAAPIPNGSGIQLNGSVALLPAGDAVDATGFDFNPIVVPDSGPPVQTTTTAIGTGVFLGLVDTDVEMKDIAEGTVVGSGPVNIVLNIDDFFVVNGLATDLVFDLTDITNINRLTDGETSITFSGTGVLGGGGYDPTQATYTLTAQGNTITAFSASIRSGGQVVDVPEPATLALFGLGLMGLAAVSRQRGRA